MADWSEVLDRDRLGLDPDYVSEVKTSEGSDLDGDPFVEVWVVLNPRITLENLDTVPFTDIQSKISQQIVDQPDAGYPFIRFATVEDWNSIQNDEEDDEEAADGIAAT